VSGYCSVSRLAVIAIAGHSSFDGLLNDSREVMKNNFGVQILHALESKEER